MLPKRTSDSPSESSSRIRAPEPKKGNYARVRKDDRSTSFPPSFPYQIHFQAFGAVFAERVFEKGVRHPRRHDVHRDGHRQNDAEQEEGDAVATRPLVVGVGGVVLGDRLVHQRADVVAILLQLIECRLYRLIDRLFNVATNVLNLIHALRPRFLSRDEDGGHVEAGAIQRGPFAQFLHDLHHDALTIALVSGLVGLGKVEAHPLRVLLA